MIEDQDRVPARRQVLVQPAVLRCVREPEPARALHEDGRRFCRAVGEAKQPGEALAVGAAEGDADRPHGPTYADAPAAKPRADRKTRPPSPIPVPPLSPYKDSAIRYNN